MIRMRNADFGSFDIYFFDRIYRITQDTFIFHHFPEESDETQSRRTAGNKGVNFITIVYFICWVQTLLDKANFFSRRRRLKFLAFFRKAKKII